MNNPEDTILAIDFGTVRIGLAISRFILAEPLEIISNDDSKFLKIKEICIAEDVKRIIVGMSENEMAKKTEVFADELRDEIKSDWENKPELEYMDETLSSHSIHEKMKFAKKSKRSADIDHLAAAEFLQEWLDENIKE
ncbi:RuvX/YqgF family protein [Patescibacteria group bacterium]|nr:RuvX/YqgF family protein [Patescibacteria group bacterium]